MHTLIGLLVAAAAACAIAMPPGPTPSMSQLQQLSPDESSDESSDESNSYVRDIMLPRMLTPHHLGYGESIPEESDEHDWLNKEINRLSEMESEEVPLTQPLSLFDDEVARWMSEMSYVEQPYEGPMIGHNLRRFVPRERLDKDFHRVSQLPKGIFIPELAPSQLKEEPKEIEEEEEGNREELKEMEDEERNRELEVEERNRGEPKEVGTEEKNRGEPKEMEVVERNRKESKEVTAEERNREENKHVDEEERNIEELKAVEIEERNREEPNPDKTQKRNATFAMTPLEEGFFEVTAQKITAEKSNGAHEGGESEFIEISPPRETRQNPNLGRTKNLVAENVGPMRTGMTKQDPDPTDKPRHDHGSDDDPGQPIYSMVLITAIGSALAMTIAGFSFGWYTLVKRAKAAAEVDYPAYGVTGPTPDSSGDRKLAHSAHMYHYQHQKQQIIAMERNGLEQRNTSMSDPESEEENEEGDYTVYECPGFATTGEMEVKNPLFTEDPTPATPGKCELVKPQPKE